MFVYVFCAIAFIALKAPWWVYVLFIACDMIDDHIYDSRDDDDQDEDGNDHGNFG